ncbi:UDP-arabinose 4-epimerase 1, putative [Babesia ovis]|uniref:UDP-arabinose 4-epimerase 1, putative n=1 Tax=Babesia ovis TaxID=5869 RepID=A0A9W5TE64_BABOV|nr:UDP-arabinose 4-epimerase 1, putative [Babesia ovis]
MDSIEVLNGIDAFQYIGVEVLIELVNGEQIKGELYSVDLQRNDIVVIRSVSAHGVESLYLVSAHAISGFKSLGPLNESVEDIPRVPYDALLRAKAVVEDVGEDIPFERGHEDHTRTTYHRRWSMRTKNAVVSSSEETTSRGEDNHWNDS